MNFSSPREEAMVLGSPGTSPANSPKLSGYYYAQQNFHSGVGLGLPSSPKLQSECFAPSFLLGSNSSFNSRPIPYGQSAAFLNNQRDLHVTWSPDLVKKYPDDNQQKGQNSSRFMGRNRQLLNQSGPPLKLANEGLFVDCVGGKSSAVHSNLEGNDQFSAVSGSINRSSAIFADQSSSQHSFQSLQSNRIGSASDVFLATKLSPGQADPFYTQGENFEPEKDLDPTWVTVFGFPPDYASLVLQKFSDCGTVIHHVISERGNWMHLKYESSLQARKALSKNTKKITDSIQIGVTPCIEKAVMAKFRPQNQIDESSVGTSSSFLLATPANTSVVTRRLNMGDSTATTLNRPLESWQTSTPAVFPGDKGAGTPAGVSSGIAKPVNPKSPDPADTSMRDGFGTPKTGMRSLTAAYEAASSPYKVTGGVGIPTKADKGMLGKAYDYMFG